MDSLFLFLSIAGLILIGSGLWVLLRQEITVSSSLLTVLMLGFFWAAVKRTIVEPHTITLHGWGKNILGTLFFAGGLLCVYGAWLWWSSV